jgi:multidrug resistance efflux pump
MKNTVNEELLKTDLMKLLGGKESVPFELKSVPPKPPNSLIYSNNGNFGEPEKLPELRSDGVNEIMALPPGWLLKWGITVFLLILLSVLAICNFVKYPDLVKGNLVILPDELPKSIVAHSDGKLEELWIEEEQEIKKGDLAGLIESTANYTEILQLDETVNILYSLVSQNEIEDIASIQLPLLFQLGDLQKPYQAFHDNYIHSKAFIKSGSVMNKRRVMNEEISTLGEIADNLKNQHALQGQEMNLAFEELKKRERIVAKGILPQMEVNTARANYLAKKLAYEQAKNSFSNHQLGKAQKKQELIETDFSITEQKNNLIQSLTVLKNDLETWKRRYLLYAPSDGKVVFTTTIEENQQIKNGQEICFVQPASSHFEGKMGMGQYNFGKVKENQKVIIKLSSYPYQQYGLVSGNIEKISTLPKDSLYQVIVKLPHPLITDSGEEIPFKTGMTASAEIITEDLSLLQRFFSEFRRIIK